MNKSTINELEVISKKIENNTATIEDYKRYEYLLQSGGLSHDYIYSYLIRAGFNSWEDFIAARKKKENNDKEASLVGAIIGLGLGLLLIAMLGSNSKK